MPASRSRSTHWRRTLTQVCERDGALEIALAPTVGTDDSPRGDLVWRVRLLRVGDHELVVESPRTLGAAVDISHGADLVAAVVIGQNRWMFTTTVLATDPGRGTHRPGALTLEMPEYLERCQRLHGRYDARGLQLPEVDLWPLLNPSSVVPMERAISKSFEAFRSEGRVDLSALEGEHPMVGPRVSATLMNIGGGGVGLRLGPEDAPILTRHHVLWLRIPLGLGMPIPLYATGKVVHTHIDSAQMTYAGISFDFSFNPPMQQIVKEQILFTVEARQHHRPPRAD